MTNDRFMQILQSMRSDNRHLKACIGFDGYIDVLYKVVKKRISARNYIPFSTIDEFAAYIKNAAGKSADMELCCISKRMGGNAPLMAESMALLDVKTSCIGSMGYPMVEPEFGTDKVHFDTYSVAPCAKTIAYEFDDGKLMFGDTASLQKLCWAEIKKALTDNTCINIFGDSDLWAIVNWSFTLCSNQLINECFKEISCRLSPSVLSTKTLFFDLADPRARPEEDLIEFCSMIRSFGDKINIVIGLNENEATCMADVLDVSYSMPLNAEKLANDLRERLGVYFLTIHGLGYASAAILNERTVNVKGVLNEHPVISTGGGDNFNAGLCTALLNGLAPEDALYFANVVSSYYVTTGKSATLESLEKYYPNYLDNNL